MGISAKGSSTTTPFSIVWDGFLFLGADKDGGGDEGTTG
jgi:hypothetical protein